LPRNKLERQEDMAKWEIHKRAGNLVDAAWWRWMPGVTINVKWPVGLVFVLDEKDRRWDWTMGTTNQSFDSADPNDHYRPWLEQNVGKQGWDWQWGLRDNNAAENRLTIKVRTKHAKWATVASLLWA
jgi:hypothetical protein